MSSNVEGIVTHPNFTFEEVQIENMPKNTGKSKKTMGHYRRRSAANGKPHTPI